MDDTDKLIIKRLKEDSKLTNKEIGKFVHLSGQAVGLRISKLIEKGIIESYTVKENFKYTQFIRIFMNSNKFIDFENYINKFENVSSLYKTSGQACYLIITHFSQDELQHFLEEISRWARYTVESMIEDKTKKEL
ncbi:transcriptional regulator [Floricoccus tropicus]|uniref:Transcriptional regulator n=1 Tax=Floricoccus tropicus TaxID=1859473 RepID=A0A1E8GMU4_9LACT|nr:winged helix-turn-helix transcriptional regulator [Floricoccus tropicus]OFI49565.1 transcriptional regulator [Floricoccus tropicus]